MDPTKERRLLQYIVGTMAGFVATLGGLVFFTGARVATWVFDVEFIEIENFAELDSSLRLFGAIVLGVAGVMAWSVPRIEQADPLIQIAAGSLVLGALGRLISAIQHGWPNTAATVLMILEASALVVFVWQPRVKRLYRN